MTRVGRLFLLRDLSLAGSRRDARCAAPLSHFYIAIAVDRFLERAMSTTTKQRIRRVDAQPAAEQPSIAPANRDHGRLRRIGEALPNLIVFGLLAGVFAVGHHTDWKLPKASELWGAGPRAGRRLVRRAFGAGIAMRRMPGSTHAEAARVRLLSHARRRRMRDLSSGIGPVSSSPLRYRNTTRPRRSPCWRELKTTAATRCTSAACNLLPTRARPRPALTSMSCKSRR